MNGNNIAIKDKPLVTIITPAYNRADYLVETIESVLAQDYPNIEYIVLNDGSKDDTEEVLKRYDGRIIWESHENMGETRTVNKGFSMACGEMIGVVNSDDPLLPGAVSALAECFVSDTELLVAYPDWEYIDQDGRVIHHIKTQDYNYLNMLLNFSCVPGPGAFFRRSAVKSLGGRDTSFRYVADFDFWLRAGMKGPFKRVPKALATFRTHPGSATVSQKGSLMAEEHVRLVKKTYSSPELPAEARRLRNRLRAYSSAYYIAGVTCGETLRLKKARYYVLSFLLYPLNYLEEQHSWRLWVVFPELLGRFYEPLRPLLRQMNRVVKVTRAAGRKMLKAGI